MTHRETILAFLDSATGPVCDDCLSERTGILPRQTVNLNCRRMEQANLVVRSSNTIECHYCRAGKISNLLSSNEVLQLTPRKQASGIEDPHSLWHWEGNIQDYLVSWLENEGWAIISAADTAAKTAGKDIIADQNGRTLWVSVKGFPKGTPKTNPSTQARHWFSHAVFDLVRYRDESNVAELAIGLPDGYVTYHNLADRVRWLRFNLPFTIYWVDESGEVRVEG